MRGRVDVPCQHYNVIRSYICYAPLAGFNPDYEVDFETQILPIIERMQAYRWVADIPYLNDFAHPRFDLTDASPGNEANRRRYFEFFRVPVLPADYERIVLTQATVKS